MRLIAEIKHLEESVKTVVDWCGDLAHPSDYSEARNSLAALASQLTRVTYAVAEQEGKLFPKKA